MFFLEDGLNTSSGTDLLRGLWIDAIGHDSLNTGRGVGGDLGRWKFILFFVCPVCSGTVHVRNTLGRGDVRCLCRCHAGQIDKFFVFDV